MPIGIPPNPLLHEIDMDSSGNIVTMHEDMWAEYYEVLACICSKRSFLPCTKKLILFDFSVLAGRDAACPQPGGGGSHASIKP